jgi:hypothetical protein
MSMNPQSRGSIPAETVRRARAVCPKGTLAMRLREPMGALYEDEQCAARSPMKGQPGDAPWR